MFMIFTDVLFLGSWVNSRLDPISRRTTTFQYTILPGEYDALIADIDLLENNQWSGYIPGKETKGTGKEILSAGAYFDINKGYKAQAVLNRGSDDEIRGEIIDLKLTDVWAEVEKKDPDEDFKDVELKWDDYYPALGDKTITIIGEKPGLSISGMTLKCEVVSAAVDGACLKLKKEDMPETMVTATFEDDQKTTIILSAPELAPTETNKDIELQFSVLSDDTPPEILLVFNEKWNIKNNSNTNLEEVLKGLAVFVCDIDPVTKLARTGDDHKGETTGDEDKLREVDFVQELLNQVVPRKRSVLNYKLLKEDGYFGALTANAVKSFKQEFNIDNTTEKSDFQKLVKDYSLTESEWINKIIDKKILIGKEKKPADNQINASADGDTGLYELYENVVNKFVKSLINLANSYRTNSNPDNEPEQWTSRTQDVVQGVNQPVAYSYGGRQTINSFNTSVSKHWGPSYDNIENTPAYSDYQNYHGNIGDASDTESDPLRKLHGIVGQGNKKWPGLHKGIEYDSGQTGNLCWYFENWAGIDCIGLTLQGLRYAETPGVYANLQALGGTGDTAIPGITIAGVCGSSDCGTINSIHTYEGLNDTNVSRFFDTRNEKLLYYWVRTDESEELIHKGDFVHYNGHISTVYSDRITGAGSYNIIHAFGWDEYNDEFSRKVMITGNDITAPTGFGRIKLWD